MLLKTGAINALLAYELLKSCQKESDEIKSQLLKTIDNKFGLTSNPSHKKFKDLKYGIELYFYYIHKKKNYLWEAIDMSQHNFGQLRESNPDKYKALKNARDSYKTYQSNRIIDLIKHYQYIDQLDNKPTNDDLHKKIESHIRMSQKKLLAELEFLYEHELIVEISKILI
jgi:hypothetical protein